ncbi:MAG: hypothetical protein DRP00_02825 [Candidatus Aenigmatarchaeota archaeon]|mgnify:CR=1 FL=1|nr:MAG: hypothetical protein DRP00_02825 [Candidatus Aenigmarchaeota archaeon]
MVKVWVKSDGRTVIAEIYGAGDKKLKTIKAEGIVLVGADYVRVDSVNPLSVYVEDTGIVIPVRSLARTYLTFRDVEIKQFVAVVPQVHVGEIKGLGRRVEIDRNNKVHVGLIALAGTGKRSIGTTPYEIYAQVVDITLHKVIAFPGINGVLIAGTTGAKEVEWDEVEEELMSSDIGQLGLSLLGALI